MDYDNYQCVVYLGRTVGVVAAKSV